MTGQGTSADARLEAVRREVENWRRCRTKKGPKPAEVWAEAVSLARELGVCRVADELGMSHGALSRRLDSSKVLKPSRAKETALSRFVEFTPSAPARAPAEKASSSTVIELTSVTGERLTVRVSQSVDIGALVANFQARQ